MSTNTNPMAVQLPTDEELVLKVIPMPADSNANGDIFGGWVMAVWRACFAGMGFLNLRAISYSPFPV